MWWSTVYTTDYTAPGDSKTLSPSTSGTPAADTATSSPDSESPSAILRHSSHATDIESLTSIPSAVNYSLSASVVTRLWQPPSNSGRRIRVPRLFLAFLSFRAVTAAGIPLRLTNMTTSYTLRPTSIFDSPPLHGTPLPCPDGLERCGHSLCYVSDAQRCCPGRLNLCSLQEICVEGRADEGDVVYGCVPPESTDPGRDPTMRTTAVGSDRESVITWSWSGSGSAMATTKGETMATVTTSAITTSTTQATQSTSTSTTASASVSKPTGSGGRRLGAPSILCNLVLFVNSVRGVTFPAPIQPECCGGICCALGEVCTRSSTGAKCWHAGKRDTIDPALDRDELTSSALREDHSDASSNVGDKKHGGAAGAAPEGHHRGHHDGKKGSASRPPISILISFTTATSASVAGAPQRSLLPKTSPATHNLSKRWSCHKPKQDCGSKGCWDPAAQFCCQQPSGDYGTCAADKGEVCCGTMCCPKDYECRTKGDYLCVPKDTPTQKGLKALEINVTASGKMIDHEGNLGSGEGGNQSGGHGHGPVVNAVGEIGAMAWGVTALVPMVLFYMFGHGA
jgi:hypothetical protein